MSQFAKMVPKPTRQKEEETNNKNHSNSNNNNHNNEKNEKNEKNNKIKMAPPYRKRKGWQPNVESDFADGGAFPEIHITQFPLKMGKPNSKNVSNTIPLNTDSEGNVKYDTILDPVGNKQVFSRHKDVVPTYYKEELLAKPTHDEEAQTSEKTKMALEKIVNQKIAAKDPTGYAALTETKVGDTFIEYTSSKTQKKENN